MPRTRIDAVHPFLPSTDSQPGANFLVRRRPVPLPWPDQISMVVVLPTRTPIRRRGGAARSSVSCRSHWSVDHAPLSRRRDGAQLLLLMEAPPTVGRCALHFFRIPKKLFLLFILSPGVGAIISPTNYTGGYDVGVFP